MENQSYVRLNPDGTSFIVRELYEQRDITQCILNQIASERSLLIKDAFKIADWNINLVIKNEGMHAICRLPSLNLTAHYTTNSEKILVPVFMKENDERAANHVLIPAVWDIPDGMRLMFSAAVADWNTDDLPQTFPNQCCHLVAFNSSGQAWQLPLPNLFDDCSVCMGQFNGRGPTIQDAVGLALGQLHKSSWNSDLVEGKVPQSQSLFRFKMTDKAVECVPLADGVKWESFCKKVSTPITDKMKEVL